MRTYCRGRVMVTSEIRSGGRRPPVRRAPAGPGRPVVEDRRRLLRLRRMIPPNQVPRNLQRGTWQYGDLVGGVLY
jgi:hypothetical protein